MKRRVVLLGPPGSGKGTVAERLQAEFKLEHISTGQWFRREMSKESELGRKVKGYVSQGELVPDECVVGLLEQWLTPEMLERGFLLDGLPRTCPQAEALDRFCARRGAPLDLVLFLDCPEAVVMDRITGRRTCLSCGSVYHVRTFPPRISGVCDKCGSALVQRADDREDVVKNRLEFYRKITEPLLDYYQESGKLVSLNAALGSEAAYNAAAQALVS